MEKLKKGDTIKCHDKDDMISTMMALAKEGIETDFLYEKDGKKGLWLVITREGDSKWQKNACSQ